MNKTAAIEKFEIPEDGSSNVGIRWKSYIKRFRIMIEAMDVRRDSQKKALLLHSAGTEVFDVYEGLSHRGIEAMDFEETIAELDNYFNSNNNEDYAIHVFRKLKQEINESVDAFHLRLRKAAKECNFHNNEKEIRTQLIERCNSQKLRRKALKSELTLDDILKTARSIQTANEQAKAMESSQMLNEIKKSKNLDHKKELKCFKCGREYPHKTVCPALGKKCNKCKRFNHFETVCRTKAPIVNEVISETENDSSDSSNFD